MRQRSRKEDPNLSRLTGVAFQGILPDFTKNVHESVTSISSRDPYHVLQQSDKSLCVDGFRPAFPHGSLSDRIAGGGWIRAQ